jgi:hypothetical protein
MGYLSIVATECGLAQKAVFRPLGEAEERFFTTLGDFLGKATRGYARI